MATAAGVYAVRLLQIKLCGRLGLEGAVLALDCCLSSSSMTIWNISMWPIIRMTK